MRRKMRRETTATLLCEQGTWASCSLDQLQQGHLTPSPAHQWTHHIDGERTHQSKTTPQETQAFSPLGKTWETVSKCNKISTNELWVKAHFEWKWKTYRTDFLLVQIQFSLIRNLLQLPLYSRYSLRVKQTHLWTAPVSLKWLLKCRLY